MSLENMKTPDKAYAKTKVTVLRLIQQKLSAGEDRLPSGEEMARMCGVSLVLIRDVLGELESRGYVSRRRGKGILINDHICRLGPRIDEQVDFMDLIRLHGMEPSVRLTDERWVDCEAAEGLAQGSTLKPAANRCCAWSGYSAGTESRYFTALPTTARVISNLTIKNGKILRI